MTNEKDALLFEADAVDEGSLYDPLADEEEEWDADDIAERYGYIGDPGELAPRSEVPPAPEKSPRERMEDLFENMIPYRLDFLKIMEYCRETRSMDEMSSFVTDLLAQRRAVYSAASFCKMLADAGALVKIDADGNPYVEVEVEPEEAVDENGMTYLKPGTPPAAFWQTTEDGVAVLEESDPIAALAKIIEENAPFRSVFRDILRLCDAEGGTSIVDLESTLNRDPILAESRRQAQFFMDYLDRNGAVAWDGAWKTTDVGKAVLASLEE